MTNLLPLKRPSMRDLLTGTVVGAGLCTAILSTSIVDWTWMKLFGEDSAFVPGAKLEFTATAYCKGTTTASGVGVRRGIAAADPQLLPGGSVVSLTTGDAAFDGVYTVLDTGPAVQGRILDLYVWSCHEALAFGRRPVQATVLRLGWDPQASQPSLIDRLFRRREARRTPRPLKAPSVDTPDPAGDAPVPATPDAVLPDPVDGADAVDPADAPTVVVPPPATEAPPAEPPTPRAP
ncbi:MAG TPA: 3D domain-containing protein [Vicinamibacterales bacterium]